MATVPTPPAPAPTQTVAETSPQTATLLAERTGSLDSTNPRISVYTPTDSYFGPEVVKRLTQDDFNTDDRSLITLKHRECTLVMFYINNKESRDLMVIYAALANQVPGPTFGIVNMNNERKVAQAFTELRSNGSHSLHWAGLRGYPSILVYRDGWPVAFYNGAREVQAMTDYVLSLPCNANYYEQIQVAASADITPAPRYQMAPYIPYINDAQDPNRVKQVSSQFTGGEPSIRGYNAQVPLTSYLAPGTAVTTETSPAPPAAPAASTSVTGEPLLPGTEVTTANTTTTQPTPVASNIATPAPSALSTFGNAVGTGLGNAAANAVTNAFTGTGTAAAAAPLGEAA